MPSAAAVRRLRKARPADLESFGARPTRRAGQFLADRYRIEGLLGSGGTSNVYLAVDTRVGHSVVIKQLNQDGASNEGVRARFLAEAEALAGFQHPRIMRVLDYATTQGEELPYLVTEALVGETLTSLLRRQPSLPLQTALMIARQTAQGLTAAHRRGVVHRDIKPDNLFLLGPRGAPFGLKVIDFGMARLGGARDQSGTHTVLGTVEYMAPEQVIADPVDGRADIYSFGVVLFRLFTGRLPFGSAEGIDLLCHQLFSPLPRASYWEPSLDPHLDAIITRATRKHPDNRYPNMPAMMVDLDVVLGLCRGEPANTDLLIDPDVYEPRHDKGREVASLLAERHSSIFPIELERSGTMTLPVTMPRDSFVSGDFEDLSDEDLELSEG